MKERLTGIGLAVSAALTLGTIWADSAQAFSLGSSVVATNTIKRVNTQGQAEEIIFETSPPKTVGSEIELIQFGGIWDIDLTGSSVSFAINSRFGEVVSGDDIYRLEALNFGSLGQSSVKGFNLVYLGNPVFNEGKGPVLKLTRGKVLEVLFPLGFAQNLNLIPRENLSFRIDLDVEPPTSVPTPALLPGLVGMGLAVLRRRG
jgi:hypothetical protein